MADDHLPPAEFRVLLALVDGAKHGHGIKLDVLDRTGGRVELGPGTLYGALKRLLRREWIAEVEAPDGEGGDGRRRFYALTSEGRRAAERETARLRELLDIARDKALEPAGGV